MRGFRRRYFTVQETNAAIAAWQEARDCYAGCTGVWLSKLHKTEVFHKRGRGFYYFIPTIKDAEGRHTP